MSSIDPTKVRLSDTLLLSDMMGCTSIYKYGYANKFMDYDTDKLEEGRYLAETLDLLQLDFGPVYICYGYISPSLSRQIVKYQDPNKPSYHRWEIGAAADIFFYEGLQEVSPAHLAAEIDDTVHYSRMITYSESEWICFATNSKESPSRQAFYENRHIPGEKKPKFIRYSPNPGIRDKQKADIPEMHDWKGQGHPSYHGRGEKQLEHYDIRRYSHFSDFLYAKRLVNSGVRNLPPFNDKNLLYRWTLCAIRAGIVVETAAKEHKTRISITSAYNSTEEKHLWRDKMTLEIAPPVGISAQDMADTFSKLSFIDKIMTVKSGKEQRIRLISTPIDADKG